MEDLNLCMHCMTRKEMEQETCPKCGFIEKDYLPEKHHLPPHTILKGQYMVGCVLGEGGFGITYIGWDMFLHLPVAIKEYFPSGVVIRDQGQHTVNVFAGKDEKSFLQGRERFFREAQKVARFDNNPGVVSVKNCFLKNGTAYIIMEYISGINLGSYAANHGGKLSMAETLRLLKTPILTLGELHRALTFHRDISPENLMLEPNGTVKLIDFGSAMESDSEKQTRVLMVRTGYSPVEMYSSSGKDGAYSDVYSMAATIYKLITGITPPSATDRLDNDPLVCPSMLGVRDITPAQEKALMKAMAVQVCDRYQNVDEFYQELYGDGSLKKPTRGRRTAALAAVLCVVVLLAAGLWFGSREKQPILAPAPTAFPAVEEADVSLTLPTLGSSLRAFLNANGYQIAENDPIPEEALANIAGLRILNDDIQYWLRDEYGYRDESGVYGHPEQKGDIITFARSWLGYERAAGEMTGELDLAELSRMTSLDYLSIWDWRVTNVESLGTQPRFRELYLDNCGLTNEDLPMIAKVMNDDPAGGTLNIANNQLTSLDGLKGMPDLYGLNVSYNQLTSAAGIADLKVHNATFEGNPALSLSELSGSRMIAEIEECAFPATDDFAILPEMKSLKSFELFTNGRPSVVLDLSLLDTVQELRSFSLSDCIVTNVGSFCKAHPELKHLALSTCQLTDDVLPAFASLEKLESLDIGYNELTSVQDLPWQKMKTLQALNIEGNYIADLSPLNGYTGELIAGNQRELSQLESIRQKQNASAAYSLPTLGPSLRAFLNANGYQIADDELIPQDALLRISAVRIMDDHIEYWIRDEEGNYEWPNTNAHSYCREWVTGSMEPAGAKMGEIDLAEFSRMYALEYLSIWDWQVTNVEALGNTPRFNDLYLDNCGLTNDDLSIIAKVMMQTDAELNLANNQLTSLEKLAGVKELEFLNLRHNQLTSLSGIADMKVQMVQTFGNPITSIRDLSGSTLIANVERFELPVLDDYSLAAEMKNLSAFWIYPDPANPITLDLAFFANAKRLDEFEISNCILQNLESFCQDHPQLLHLGMVQCQITDDKMPALASLEKLEWLNLGFNRLTSVETLPWRSMPKLQELNLNENALSDLSPLNGYKGTLHTENQRDAAEMEN